MTTEEEALERESADIIRALRAYTDKWFGPRCPEHDDDCVVCQLWALTDRLEALASGYWK